jgi:hypothetical protein
MYHALQRYRSSLRKNGAPYILYYYKTKAEVPGSPGGQLIIATGDLYGQLLRPRSGRGLKEPNQSAQPQ